LRGDGILRERKTLLLDAVFGLGLLGADFGEFELEAGDETVLGELLVDGGLELILLEIGLGRGGLDSDARTPLWSWTLRLRSSASAALSWESALAAACSTSGFVRWR